MFFSNRASSIKMHENASRPKTTKNVYFYKSGDERFQGVKLPVNTKKYRTLDALLDDLSYKVPGLSYGVRRISTPKGRHHVKKVEQLKDMGSYICSDKTQAKRVAGVDVKKATTNGHRMNFMTSPPNNPAPHVSLSKSRKVRRKSKRRSKSAPDSQTTSSTKSNRKPPVPTRKKLSREAKKSKGKKRSESDVGRKRPTKSRSVSPTKEVISDSLQSDDLDKLLGRKRKKKATKDIVRASHSAPGTPSESRAMLNTLSPLDDKKLKHVQRRRLASHSVSTDEYTLPPNDMGKKKMVKKKSKHKTYNTWDDWTTPEHNDAALKIQSHYRGYYTRKEVQERKEAAEKIQAHYKGYKTRQAHPPTNSSKREKGPARQKTNTALADFSDVESDAASSPSHSGLDMTQEEAATKIQAVYRGHRTRKQQQSKKWVEDTGLRPNDSLIRIAQRDRAQETDIPSMVAVSREVAAKNRTVGIWRELSFDSSEDDDLLSIGSSDQTGTTVF